MRKSREVDPSGRLKEDVVEAWWRSWQVGGSRYRQRARGAGLTAQDKTIETLLRQLTSVFEVAPPVYARPPEQQAQAGPSRPIAQPSSPMAERAGPSVSPVMQSPGSFQCIPLTSRPSRRLHRRRDLDLARQSHSSER